MKKITGKDLIKYITENHLEDSVLEVTAIIYHHGDHDCISTTEISLMKNGVYDEEKKEYIPAIEIYVDDNLY